LRFQPSGGLPIASEFKVKLDPDKILQKGAGLHWDSELTVRTDKFPVEEVSANEEPALEGKDKVVLGGEMRGSKTLRREGSPGISPALPPCSP
jgi:hypothetical protein